MEQHYDYASSCLMGTIRLSMLPWLAYGVLVYLVSKASLQSLGVKK